MPCARAAGKSPAMRRNRVNILEIFTVKMGEDDKREKGRVPEEIGMEVKSLSRNRTIGAVMEDDPPIRLPSPAVGEGGAMEKV